MCTLDNLSTFLTTIIQQREKIILVKKQRFVLMLASNSLINKYVYITKSQFLFITELLKM